MFEQIIKSIKGTMPRIKLSHIYQDHNTMMKKSKKGRTKFIDKNVIPLCINSNIFINYGF